MPEEEPETAPVKLSELVDAFEFVPSVPTPLRQSPPEVYP